LLRTAAVIGLVVAGCSRDRAGQAEAAPGKAPVLRPIRNLDIDLDQLARGSAASGAFVPAARVIGADATASFELPGPFPGRIAHVAADGALTVVDGRLMSDAPLRFVRDGDRMRALPLGAGPSYTAVERVTAAAPWSASAPPATGCCG